MKDSTCSRTKYVTVLTTTLFWVAVWYLAYVLVGKDYIIPSPLHTLFLMGEMLITGIFWINALWTLLRVASGMVLSFVLGAISAAGAYFLPAVRRILSGPVVALKSVPIMSVIMLAILALPTNGVPIFVCFLMCYPVVYTNLLTGLDSVDPQLIEMCQVYGIYGKRRFLVLFWPSIRSYVKAALILITGLSWKTVVASEVFAVPRHSMGYHLLSAKAVLAADELFAWTIAIVILSCLSEKIVKQLLSRERKYGWDKVFCSEKNKKTFRNGTVELCNVSKSFGELELYRDFSMTIPGGKVTAVAGASGCGKTTLLRMIAGLERPDRGTITPVTVSCVFQEDRLLPWMTVRENLRLVASSEAVDEMLTMMKLAEFAEYLPAQLSGGMRRRVAVGRALVYDGDILLMDEPFTGLDPELKTQLISEMGTLWKEQGRTVFFITHDKGDANALADQICQLSGRPVVFG
ncbi:MAG: ATP-binding cassette domain-containing protein [Firmicutes bacterium]|nr:ATP-binding cassette domain-containing protein [Bacillota bacterium]